MKKTCPHPKGQCVTLCKRIIAHTMPMLSSPPHKEIDRQHMCVPENIQNATNEAEMSKHYPTRPPAPSAIL